MFYDILEQKNVFLRNKKIQVQNFQKIEIFPKNGLETKISRTFLDFLHLGHEFFVISGHGA